MEKDLTYYRSDLLHEYESPMVCQKVAMTYFNCLQENNVKKPINKKVCVIERKTWIDNCERPYRYRHL